MWHGWKVQTKLLTSPSFWFVYKLLPCILDRKVVTGTLLSCPPSLCLSPPIRKCFTSVFFNFSLFLKGLSSSTPCRASWDTWVYVLRQSDFKQVMCCWVQPKKVGVRDVCSTHDFLMLFVLDIIWTWLSLDLTKDVN